MPRSFHGRLPKAISWTIADGLFNAIYSVLMLVLIGLFLSPAELGLTTVAISVVQLVEATYASGFQECVLRSESAHTQHSDTTHTLAIAFSCLGCLLSAGGAVVLAHAYNDQTLIGLTLLASVSLIFNALALIPNALFGRKLRTNVVASRNIMAKAFSASTFLICGMMGLGAWSVVLATVASSLGAFLLLRLKTPRWPRLRLCRLEIPGILRYSIISSMEGLCWIGTNRIFMLLFGYFHGTSMLGLFQFACRMVDEIAALLQTTVIRIGLPFFAKLNDKKDKMKNAYLLGTRIINSLSAPVYMGVCLTAPIFIPLFFGEKWKDAILLTQVVALSWLLVFPRILVPTIIKAIGKPEYNLFFSLFKAVWALILVLATSSLGPTEATLGWGTALLINLPLQLRTMKIHLGVSISLQVKQTLPAITSAFGMGAALFFLQQKFLGAPPLLALITLVFTGFFTYTVLLWLLDRSVFGQISGFIKNKKAKPPA